MSSVAGRRRVRQAIVGVILVSVAGFVFQFATESGRAVPYRAPRERPVGDLVDLTDGYWWYSSRDEPGEWMTAAAITVRNRRSRPIRVLSVTFDRIINLERGHPWITGPLSPSLTFQLYDGWPADDQGPEFTDWPPDTRPVRGFTIPPEVPGGTSPPAAGQLIADEENDATVLVKIGRRDPTRNGYVLGVRIRYRLGDVEHVAHFPKVEFGLCTAKRFETSTCTRDHG